MTNEEIKDIIKQTGVPLSMPFDEWCIKFARLVADKQLKDCIKVCDDIEEKNYTLAKRDKAGEYQLSKDYFSASIGARQCKYELSNGEV